MKEYVFSESLTLMSISETYPVLIIPEDINKAINAEPPLPKKPIEPKYPGILLGIKPAKIKYTMTFVCVSIIIYVLYNTILYSIIPGVSMLIKLTPIFSIILLIMRLTQTSSEIRKNIHIKNLERYHREQKKYKKGIEEVKNEKYLKEFRKSKLIKALKRTVSHDGNKISRQGASEEKFYECLIKYFRENIQRGKKVENPDFIEFPYVPDFCYIDNKIKLHIDIEIDEPYTLSSPCKPIHYIGLKNEITRNDYFKNKRGWIVIRFSEEQIVRYPESCCKFIGETINKITYDPFILDSFDKIQDIKKVKRWTEEEAKEMIKINYRRTYLGDIGI